MSYEIVALIAILAVFALAIVFRNTSFVKRYWKYLLILIPGVLLLVLKIIQDAKNRRTEDKVTESTSATKDHIQEIKEQITEVQTVAKVEAAVAKTKNDAKMEELKEVQAIKDARERRRRLAEMIG